jgi:polyphosphate glucokinase
MSNAKKTKRAADAAPQPTSPDAAKKAKPPRTSATKRAESTPSSAMGVGPYTLALDIGGTGLKGMVLDAAGKPINERTRVETPRPATPGALLEALAGIVAAQSPFDRVSVGFPGVVIDGTVQTAPNLDAGWPGFALAEALAKLTKKPTRVLNDAAIQGFGAIEGKGLELCLTLGTGVGSSLFIDGRLVPNLELGHHPFRKRASYEDYLDNATFERLGKKKWSKRVREALAQLQPIFNPRVIYLGGGNAKRLVGDLPENVRVVSNDAGILGGIALWR